ncbi:MAG: hypothetical protein IJP68_07600 [Selenomonadaceae bacterium]|nr:hypothetical protein [Selenomonadaceae bacterium]
MARIGVSLNEEQMRRFEALADLEQKRPATLAAELIMRHMSEHKREIDLILRARDAYANSLAKVRTEDFNASEVT